MPQPTESLLDVSTDGGVVTARILADAVEEREATIILNAVKEAMKGAGKELSRIVLDFGEMTFINSSGLAACIELRNGAAERGIDTIIYRPTDDVHQLFKMVKIDRLYTFALDAEQLEALLA